MPPTTTSQIKIPSKAELDYLLEQQTISEAMKFAALASIKSLIEENKLPYKLIEDDKGIWSLKLVGDSTDAWLARFVTINKEMLELKQEVSKLSTLDADDDQLLTILISGPTGTGKEILARALHGNRAGEFVAINCAGLPSELVESELFGHIKGSFTGATDNKIGMMKLANKGTIFLDEVGELPLLIQSKLLRAIQEREIRAVGSNKTEKVTCRVVCATHRNLRDMCSKETFRIDLYARLSTYELFTTALDHRKEDVIPITKSIKGGDNFLKLVPAELIEKMDTSMNVRSIQQAVKRFNVLNKLPI